MNYKVPLTAWINVMCVYKMHVFSINIEENAFLINYHSKILYFSVELEMWD